jgi:multifunctional methyltransferase subunit TRM112
MLRNVVCFFVAEVITKLLSRVNWECLHKAAADMKIDNPLNETMITFTTAKEGAGEPDYKNDEAFLRYIHHLLFEVHLLDGFLVCPQSGRKFPVKDGIPNMLLHEDEI